VTIVLKDGTRHEIHVEHATGSPENPMSDVVLRAKYDALAREAFAAERADALWHAVWTLDEAPDVSEVAGLMQLPRR
jgi:2-methylcitrate dehydratase PrpD